MTFKLAFSGLQGNGKTTSALGLAAWLKRSSYTCGLVTNSGRGSHRMMQSDFSIWMHLEIIGIHLTEEMRASQFSQFVITDRSLLDFIAFGVCRKLSVGQHANLFSAMDKLCSEYVRTYDEIVFIRGSLGNPDRDAARKANDIMPQSFEDVFRAKLHEYEIQDRVHFVETCDALECAKSLISQHWS